MVRCAEYGNMQITVGFENEEIKKEVLVEINLIFVSSSHSHVSGKYDRIGAMWYDATKCDSEKFRISPWS